MGYFAKFLIYGIPWTSSSPGISTNVTILCVWIASLYYESWYYPMKYYSIVKPAVSEIFKILDMLWGHIRIKLNFYWSLSSFDSCCVVYGGQVIYCSTTTIWHEALIRKSKSCRISIGLIDIPFY